MPSEKNSSLLHLMLLFVKRGLLDAYTVAKCLNNRSSGDILSDLDVSLALEESYVTEHGTMVLMRKMYPES